MNQKQIGVLLIILAVLIGAVVMLWKAKEDFYINSIIDVQGGSCYLEDGTCLHGDRNYTPYILGYVVAAAMLILGIYLLFFERTHQEVLKQNKEVSEALKESKKKDEFEAFLSGFTEEERKVIKAVHDQEGIPQNTLRLKTGMSKSSLSLLLKNLENRKIITRKPEKKTNRIFLVKRF